MNNTKRISLEVLQQFNDEQIEVLNNLCDLIADASKLRNRAVLHEEDTTFQERMWSVLFDTSDRAELSKIQGYLLSRK